MSNPAGDAVLHIADLERTYGKDENAITVLKNANLTINRGEMVALVAPSGTGKSTLLHSAGLLERPNSGEIWLSGKETSRDGRPRQNIPSKDTDWVSYISSTTCCRNLQLRKI